MPQVISFAAPSGTGKTTLICSLIEPLKAHGLRVATVKSDAHRVQLDTPGKDTHRMRESGSLATALVSRDQVAIFRDSPAEPVDLAQIIDLFFADMDVVLAEGFRNHGYPTIVVERTGVSASDWKWPEDVVGYVSDGEHADLPTFGLDDTEAICDFLVAMLSGDAS
jgi:molybdopterin-guanine dinucleotide biosynthesis protein B